MSKSEEEFGSATRQSGTVLGHMCILQSLHRDLTRRVSFVPGCEVQEELQQADEVLVENLTEANAAASSGDKISLDENGFRFMLNEDAMATEKTAQGIRAFSADIVTLETLVESKR